MESWVLKQRQAFPLDLKIQMSKAKIKKWYKYWLGEVYVAFSGGKDSTVLLHLVRSLYPKVPAVFADTGLEYPEIRDFVKTVDNVIWVRPKKSFKKVIDKCGFPVISKKNARFIRDLQNPTSKNKATRNLRLTGLNKSGKLCPSMMLPEKWRFLIDAPFKISEQCCEYIKKEPLNTYSKESGRMPYTGMMASESASRSQAYRRNGCNMFSVQHPTSSPLGFWTEADIKAGYLKECNVPYCKLYDQGETRTGCMFCMFGVHLEKEPNRFQRMQHSHPKQWNYCINKLGLGKVLDYIKVPYTYDLLWERNKCTK